MNVTPDEIPKKVGRYEIVESIGFGAMGAVYKALDPLIDRTVAIKTIRLDIPPDSPHYRTFLERFYTEAKISGTLSHPNVVTLYDIGETEDQIPYLAMEYVDGETVADMLATNEQLRPEQVVALVSQMAAAIDYAHGKGVIHRDIKPSNIIVYDGEKVKVTDFGIAKLMDAEGTHSLLGTPSYMSPEQAMGEELDGRTDIFSLGVVAFEMLSGEQPFPGNNVTSILYKLVHSDPVRPTNLEVLGLLPNKWHAAFNKVLAKSPPERYQSAAEFVSNLELCLGSWFGSLEGETVVMTSPEATVMDLRGVASETASQGPQVEESEETILLESAETRANKAPVSEQPPEHPEVPQTSEEQELETISLKPDQAGVETRTMGRSSQVEPSEEPTVLQAPVSPSGGLETPETATLALGSEETHAMKPETPVPPSEEETVAILKPESLIPERKDEPVTARNVKWLAGSRKLPATVLAVMALALVAIVAGAVYWIIGKPESPPVPFEPAASEPALVTGTLTVRSSPEGATVLVDGEDRGVTPLELAELDLGVYVVRVEKSGFKPQELVAEINEDTNMAALDVALERIAKPAPAPSRAMLEIRSTPSGAQVLMDGQVVGKTPIEGYLARPGRHTFLIQKEGFKPYERSIDLVAGVSGSVSASLEAIEEEPPPPPERPPEPEVKMGDLVELGPDVIRPECIECPNPPYPEAANRAKMEGVVEVSFIVSETGTVQNIQVVESAGEVFDSAIVEVVKTWRFKPATKQGIPVKVRWTQRFRYRQG